MEEIKYVERKNSNCNKWDEQTGMFGEENLHAMWVADMDFRVPQCVIAALRIQSHVLQESLLFLLPQVI